MRKKKSSLFICNDIELIAANTGTASEVELNCLDWLKVENVGMNWAHLNLLN